jgi:hypothetical protein
MLGREVGRAIIDQFNDATQGFVHYEFDAVTNGLSTAFAVHIW